MEFCSKYFRMPSVACVLTFTILASSFHSLKAIPLQLHPQGRQLSTMSSQPQATGGIVGAFCFPHGAITLDPYTRDFSGVPANKPDSKENCIKLHEAMQKQADALIATKPDLIFLSTPHGLGVQDSYLFLANKLAKGSAEWEGDWTEFTGQFEVDTTVSRLFFDQLRQRNNPVERLGVGYGFLGTLLADTDALPLRWGEVIPWHFINEAAKRANYTLPPVVYIGQPFKRSDDTKEEIPELTKLGNDIADIILQDSTLNNRRIAVVISSDLSHYHSSDPTSPYPYEPNSSVFDALINDWASINYQNSTLDQVADKLTVKGGDLVDSIGSCGYTGLVMLHGILQHMVQSSNAQLKSNLLYYSAPTYYGMMVNYWLPIP